MSTEITVRGSFSAHHPPERATAHVTLGFEGPALPPVYDRVVADVRSVQASVEALHDPERGPVTWWATRAVRTWANRPWNNEGKQLPMVHHAAIGLEVKFRDFAALTTWVAHHVGATEGFSLDGVVWALTEQRRLDLERTVRTRAVQDAAHRAQEYADALSLGPVRPVALADAGLLGAGLHPQSGGGAPFARAAAMAKESGGDLELSPEDIEIAVSIDARFAAG